MVEGHEVHEAVALDGVHVLGLELVAGHVEDHEVRILLLDGDAGGLDQVRLAETRSAENEQRVERSPARGVGNVAAGVDAELVALPFHEVREAVDRVQPRVDLQALDTGEDKRAGAAGRLRRVDGDRFVGRSQAMGGREHHGLLQLHRADHVMELGAGADGALERHLEEIQIGALDVVAEEIRGDFHGQGALHEGDRTDGLEPRVKLLRINVVGNDLQTVIPHGNMSFLSGHEGLFDWFWIAKMEEKFLITN